MVDSSSTESNSESSVPVTSTAQSPVNPQSRQSRFSTRRISISTEQRSAELEREKDPVYFPDFFNPATDAFWTNEIKMFLMLIPFKAVKRTSSCYEQMTQSIDQFNRCHKWLKRGISRIPIIHPVALRLALGKISILQYASIVVEVGQIEIGRGLWTKVKQMTVFAIGSILSDGVVPLLNKIRVIQADTLSVIHGGWTAGSTTSVSNCEVVRICANISVERLAPLKEKLEPEMGSVNGRH